MSAFQDFGYLSERRRAERQQRRRKLLMIAGATVSVVLILAVVGATAFVYYSKQPNRSTTTTTATSSSSGSSSTKGSRASSAVQVICSPTDYRSACESSLTTYANSSSSPKDLVRAAVSSLVDEVGKAFNRVDSIESDDPEVKSAVDSCKEMHQYAVDELARTLGTIDAHNLNQLPKQVHELKNWLSAVSAYQQTCIDGFPDGEMKSKMQTAMNTAKQLTSNALAVVGSLHSFLSLHIPGLNRRLLAAKPEPAFREDGVPSWVSDGDHRILLGRAAKQLTPNVTVAKDGSGDFTTISDALAKIPMKYEGRYVIYVKAGVYEEQVVVDKNMINVTMYGDGSRKTIVTGSKNFVDGTKTFQSATFAAIGDGFMAVAIGFQNTAGAIKHQAVALRVQSDRAIFLNCRMEAYQDTLYTHSHRQFYRGCLILGTVDFIFGDAAAVFQNCILTVRRPLDNQQNIVLAQGRDIRHESTGYVIHNCRIVPDDSLVPDVAKISSYLGRPWKEFSHTVIMESDIGDFISPDGYMPWEGDFALKTLSYKEYNNKGGGADTSKRVKWPGVKVISRDEANTYTTQAFIQGDDWITKTNTPVRLGLFGQ
ncbi:unnamed protein product [Musa acuminata subsp. malaccensis]|uniref:Pectinesterase n=1 Tax=Musa acuminata subsp. malaccensis TaxID=214687 RepID=A0A804KJ96_MUSAM|nr:PREDICTED: pectinesterase-like [Musa acuminata subsp. malaccensis]CAG1835097.1 unnamed protein product [Musa acuminata subsp. malaccensis]